MDKMDKMDMKMDTLMDMPMDMQMDMQMDMRMEVPMEIKNHLKWSIVQTSYFSIYPNLSFPFMQFLSFIQFHIQFMQFLDLFSASNFESTKN